MPRYPPIITVGAPTTMLPPCAVVSPILAAGLPPIITVAEPLAMVSGGPTHTQLSPTTADDRPSDMRDWRYRRRYHWTGMHIGQPGCWWHLFLLYLLHALRC